MANQVRELAQHTSRLATEIRDVINDTQTHINTGITRVDYAQTRMNEVSGYVTKMGTELEQIHDAAHEQSAGIQEIHKTITQLDTITQQNASLVQDLAQVANEMDHQTSTALMNLRVFRLTAQDKTHAESDAVQIRRHMKSMNDVKRLTTMPADGDDRRLE